MSHKNPLAIIILAAGKGTRMKSATPKLLHKVAGLPMMNWLLHTAENLEPEKIVVVIGPDMDELASACAPHEIAIQKIQNGTGGAVKAAMPTLDGFTGDVLILLGDAPLIKIDTLKNLIAARHDQKTYGLSVLGCHLENPYGYGRLLQNADGTLSAIVEEKDATDEQRRITLINTGAFCADGTALPAWIEQLDNNNAQSEFYITQLPEILAKNGQAVSVCEIDTPEEIQGANTRAELAKLERTAQNRLRHVAMMNGVTLIDPDTVYFSFDTEIENDVTIEPNVFFGSGVCVESGVRIKSFSHIEDSRIAKNAVIGPFARLRPGAEIGESVRIGNFVEIKKSTIGKGSKINHLAYVGDCTMGENVNFSAGAITVNYDGVNKYKTTIESGAMIGSDVSLVAPVTIGENAFIAAGSTITSDVPADTLAIAREKPRTISNWSKRKKK